jgi:hexosaminidase
MQGIKKQFVTQLSIGLLLILSLSGIAQPNPTIDLKAEWQPIQNNYEGKAQSLSVLTLTNNSAQALPAKGWTIYFNGNGSFLNAENNGLKASPVNGDLSKLEPAASFAGLAPGQSVKYNIIKSGGITNFSTAPRGLYLVFSNDPAKSININSTILDPPATFLESHASTKTGWMNPAYVYGKNAGITDIPADQLPQIFPTPTEYKALPQGFVLNGQTVIYAEPVFSKQAAYLANELSSVLTSKPRIITQLSNAPVIVLKKGDQTNKEAYSLDITPNMITISASGAGGIIYGIQSLKSLLPPLSWKSKQQSIQVPGAQVKDEPRFGYRSFMLDVARNFQPKDEILKVLDLMSLYKLNVLHLHFSDDEGWRVEIVSLPELTQVGARRGNTPDNKSNIQPSYGSGGEIDKFPGSGFYTRKDFVEILRYAAERNIQVIPEIESPGHARAAVKAMENRYAKLMKQGKPEEAKRYLLTEPNDPSTYRSVQGWTDNVMNPAMPSVYTFMEKVTDELISMYKEAAAPLTTVHFGGDEVPAGVWAKSAAYQKLKNANPSIKTTDDVWYYYFGKLDAMVKKRGLFISGWEEAGMRKTVLDGRPTYIANPDFADDHFQLHVWNNTIGSANEDLPYRLANAGYKVVLSPVSNQYFDLAYNNSYYEPGQNWGGYVDVDKPFYFIPYDFLKNVKEDGRGNPVNRTNAPNRVRLTDYGKSNIVGVQGLLWSENNITSARMEYMMLPKVLGLAERAWSKDPDWAIAADTAESNQLYNKAWSVFVNTMGKRELPRLNYYHQGYQYRIPDPGLIVERGTVKANVQIPGLEIRYTINGSEPTASSALYNQPIATKGTIKAAVFDSSGRRGRITEIENK